MSRLLITAVKLLLLLLLTAAAALGALLLADHMGWPRWSVAVALAGLFFVIALILFLRRYYFRRREAKFVRRVVEQDQKAIDASPVHERRALLELQERWAAAVASLRASRLGRHGDPLYRLPWFMVFGETGSGKSTAVAHARLTNILGEAGPAKGIASTRNCDWWFFKNAIILDTAGRYAVPLADEDSGEWERFLVLLAKYRRKEPLNGLIVTLPADRLLDDDADALTEYGRSIRLRIDQLMRVLGAKFPVYVLMTKADRLLGMTAMAELLPENLRGQAMGLLNSSENDDPLDFLRRAMGHVSRRLKDLRLQLARQAGRAGSRAVLFPDEFERLAPGIQAFARGAFHENPYQETPFLRGFFISSGRQAGSVRSGVLGALASFKERQWRLPDTGLGLFLHDFFDAILPGDRAGFRPIGEYLSWRKATANLALAAWLLLLLTAIGLSGFAYRHVRQAIEPAHASFPQAPQLGARLADDMVTLGLLRDRIAEMEMRLHSRIPAMVGFDQGREALDGLKRTYNQWFRAYILNPTDQAMKEKFTPATLQAGQASLAPYLEYLAWRVEILKAREAGRAQRVASDQDDPLPSLAVAFGGRLPYVTAFFADMYRSYAAWEEDPGILQRERAEMEVWADHIIALEGRDLGWLIGWADARPDLAPITLDDFWGGHGRVQDAPRISGALTVQGKAQISRLIDRLRLAARDAEAFDHRVAAFWETYATTFLSQWTAFARDFDRGMERLLARNDWLSSAAAMTTLDNPYYRYITRMDQELAAVRDIRPEAATARLTGELIHILQTYSSEQGKSGLQAKIAEKLQRIEAHLDRRDNILAAAETFGDYMQQLDALVPVTANANAAYRFAVQHFGQTDPQAEPSPVILALGAINQMRSLLGTNPADDETLWGLMDGPLQFLVTLTTHETACGLNDVWQSQVVAETAGTPERQLWGALFGEKGVVPGFLSESARPFLRRTREGWSSVAWMGVTFPFDAAFLSFLDQGAVRRQQLQPKYTVSIATLPTDVNEDARSEAYQTRLTLQCAGRPQFLDNYNAPASKDFVYDPDSCDDVTLTIYFEETTLTRTWKGQWGFRDFLRTFRDGRKVYTADDFPHQSADLKRIGVRRIQVNYILKDAAPVMAIEHYPPLNVPQRVARCWSGLAAAAAGEGAGHGTSPSAATPTTQGAKR